MGSIDVGVGGLDAGSANAWPHLKQNLAPAGNSVPQDGQLESTSSITLRPHCMQNSASSGFSVLQCGHFICNAFILNKCL